MLERSFFEIYDTEMTMFLFVVLFINCLYGFLIVKGELFNKKNLIKLLVTFNGLFLISFLVSYILLRPQVSKDRIAFLPTKINVEGMNKDYSFWFTQQIEENVRMVTDTKFLFHSQWWTFTTLNKSAQDSIELYKSMNSALNCVDQIELELNKVSGEFVLSLKSSELVKDYSFSKIEDFKTRFENIIWDIAKAYDFKFNIAADYYGDIKSIAYKKNFYNAEYDININDFEANADKSYEDDSKIWIARSFLMRGAQKRVAFDKNNPYADLPHQKDFNKGKALLFPLFNDEKRNFSLYSGMIESFLYDENYDEADDLIKGFLTDLGTLKQMRRTHPEVLYYYSFLHPSRFVKDSYKNKRDVLKDCLSINPFYERALIKWADISFDDPLSSREEQSDVIEFLEEYSKMNPQNRDIEMSLGKYYIKYGHSQKALALFKRLRDEYGESALIHYNLGVVYYQLAKYIKVTKPIEYPESLDEKTSSSRAVFHFKKSIEEDNKFLDSYLYLGEIYRKQNKIDSAVTMFRFRVKNKTGPNDKFANEASKGLRKIFSDTTLFKEYLSKELINN
jgi:hypothetical protein